jgi:hypothetical protein
MTKGQALAASQCLAWMIIGPTEVPGLASQCDLSFPPNTDQQQPRSQSLVGLLTQEEPRVPGHLSVC